MVIVLLSQKAYWTKNDYREWSIVYLKNCDSTGDHY